MKAFYILVLLALIGGGYYFFTQNSTPSTDDMGMSEEEHADIDEHDEGDTHEDGDIHDEDVTTTMPVPAPGNEDVDEMIVHDDGDMLDDDEHADEPATTESHVFDLSGANFAFSVKEIRVQEGDTVTINFSSADGFHDWVVDEFDAATERVQTGQTASVTFVADKAGTFEYYCSVGQHRANGMVGTLIVE